MVKMSEMVILAMGNVLSRFGLATLLTRYNLCHKIRLKLIY